VFHVRRAVLGGTPGRQDLCYELRVVDPARDESQADACRRLGELLAVLTPVLDIVGGPVDEPEAPDWCQERGWTDFLLAIPDPELAVWESLGLRSNLLDRAGVPATFRELFEGVSRVTELPRPSFRPLTLPPAALRGVPARKREQLSTLLGALDPLAKRAGRIVDVGAGSGHFSRLSAELFERETVALDRDGSRLERGSALSEERSRHVGTLDVRFVQADLSLHALPLRATDLAVGLHACGALGDRLVVATSEAGCSVALVSCCLQKIDAPVRVGVSRTAATLLLKKSDLGLTNLTFRAQGVEATLGDNLRAREVRLALRRLLCERGLDVGPGEEMRGVNRRQAQAGLAVLASRVLAHRALAPATARELGAHAESARRDYASMRRLSLPRHLLARLVELSVVFDRAARLEETGLAVQVVQLFESHVTPRNTLLLAGPG
jgi:SAM-dependent methyltransferase